jgi:hypothetical protein
MPELVRSGGGFDLRWSGQRLHLITALSLGRVRDGGEAGLKCTEARVEWNAADHDLADCSSRGGVLMIPFIVHSNVAMLKRKASLSDLDPRPRKRLRPNVYLFELSPEIVTLILEWISLSSLLDLAAFAIAFPCFVGPLSVKTPSPLAKVHKSKHIGTCKIATTIGTMATSFCANCSTMSTPLEVDLGMYLFERTSWLGKTLHLCTTCHLNDPRGLIPSTIQVARVLQHLHQTARNAPRVQVVKLRTLAAPLKVALKEYHLKIQQYHVVPYLVAMMVTTWQKAFMAAHGTYAPYPHPPLSRGTSHAPSTEVKSVGHMSSSIKAAFKTGLRVEARKAVGIVSAKILEGMRLLRFAHPPLSSWAIAHYPVSFIKGVKGV